MELKEYIFNELSVLILVVCSTLPCVVKEMFIDIWAPLCSQTITSGMFSVKAVVREMFINAVYSQWEPRQRCGSVGAEVVFTVGLVEWQWVE